MRNWRKSGTVNILAVWTGVRNIWICIRSGTPQNPGQWGVFLCSSLKSWKIVRDNEESGRVRSGTTGCNCMLILRIVIKYRSLWRVYRWASKIESITLFLSSFKSHYYTLHLRPLLCDLRHFLCILSYVVSLLLILEILLNAGRYSYWN